MASDFQTLSDEEMARETRAGSLAAFEELVRRYEQRIYAFITHCCRNRADAQELTQDTFVRAFQAIAQFDPRRGFATWLFTIARRKCIDHHRAAPPASAEEPMPELPDLADPAELLAQREDQQNLWQIARRRLPEAQFQALWLRYAEEMSVGGIARVLRKTQTHVKVLLFRAREVLRQELKATQGLGRTFPCAAADVSPRHRGSAQNAPSDPTVRKLPVREGERPREPKHPLATRENQGSRERSASQNATLQTVCDVGGCALAVNRVKGDVEFPGAVAGVGPGAGKKGLL